MGQWSSFLCDVAQEFCEEETKQNVRWPHSICCKPFDSISN